MLNILSILCSFSFWISIALILVLRSIIKTWSLRKRLPPGPTPWPLLGNYFGLKLGTHDVTLKVSEQFGDIFTIFVLTTPIVILTKYEQAKSVFSQTTFNSRLDNGMTEMLLGGAQDVAFAKYGPLWQFHRKIVNKCMREIVDIASLEDKVIDAVDQTVSDMLANKGTVSPQLHMRHVVYNILAQFAYGQSFKIDDPEFLHLQKLNDDGNKEFATMLALDTLPFAKYVIPYLKSWPLRSLPLIKRVLAMSNGLNGIRNEKIAELRSSYVPGQTRNFTDAILREQKALEKEGPDQVAQLTDGHVSSILFDIFSAGTDTTSHSLTWFCLFMVMHPEIQEECYRAINEILQSILYPLQVIGDRPPKLEDKPNLPIVEASLLETLRLRPAAPMGLPHSNSEDAEIGPYFIPKDSSIIANIYAMHIDPEHWKSPLTFDPRLHFMDDEDNITKPTSFAPFGFGRRICPGEQLARNNSFMIAARLLQKVRLEPLDGVKYTLDYDVEQDFVFAALPYFVKVTSRD